MSEVKSADRPKTWREHNTVKREFKRQLTERKLEKLEQKKLETEKEPKPAATESKCKQFSTLSIAVPGSILDNAQSSELRSYLAGQIARAACIFCVDEVIVYDDVGVSNVSDDRIVSKFDGEGEVHTVRRCCAQLARILQYLECPQYLRKAVFPIHKDLHFVGLANPLDAPHHLRQNDEFPYREGVVLNQTCKSGSMADVGLLLPIRIDRVLPPGFRVTVAMSADSTKRGTVVSPMEPRVKLGVYWGYSVRIAASLSAVFSQCPYPEGYDVTIGTSERGQPVESVKVNKHRHALVVFGGLSGLEAALENDEILTVDDPSLLFNYYINTCPNQGSGTIRTEEAILISLAELRRVLVPKYSSSRGLRKEDKIRHLPENEERLESSLNEENGEEDKGGSIHIDDDAGNRNSSFQDGGSDIEHDTSPKKRKKKKSKRDSIQNDGTANEDAGLDDITDVKYEESCENANVADDVNLQESMEVGSESNENVSRKRKKHKRKKLE